MSAYDPSVFHDSLDDVARGVMRVVTYTGNGSVSTGTIGSGAVLAAAKQYKSTTLSLQITPVANGYVVGEIGCVDQYVCITMDDVKDRVIALLAAHHMDMQK